MLQSSMFAQLERIKALRKILSRAEFKVGTRKKATHMSTVYVGPACYYRRRTREALEMLGPDEKHWFAGGIRASSVAVEHLAKHRVIAVPTDTIYGFAAMAQSREAVEKLYAIKGRERTKPLAITLSRVAEISEWAEVQHLPPRLLRELLPGPVTVVLERKSNLNSRLNPGNKTIGIRVPKSKFILQVCNMINQPLALTSANVSSQPSSLHPEEFAPLWPKLAAIFYDIPNPSKMQESQRVGSTVVDLTVPGEFEILRPGVRFAEDLRILEEFGVRRYPATVNDASKEPRRQSNL